MKLLKACSLAFSMYSRVPMPNVEWDKHSMEYIFCFFPLVGVILGILFILWWKISQALGLNTMLTASIFTALPIIYTGGIHFDGFCDTCDALASNASREKKLEILKDSHIGAFALISCVIYFIIQFGLWCQAIEDGASMMVLGSVFILSRSLSALGALTMKNARRSGMLFSFTYAVVGKRVLFTVIVWLTLCAVLLLLLDTIMGLGVLLSAILVYIYYLIMSRKNFGGITGDLAGYFLQMCELVCLAAVVLVGRF